MDFSSPKFTYVSSWVPLGDSAAGLRAGLAVSAAVPGRIYAGSAHTAYRFNPRDSSWIGHYGQRAERLVHAARARRARFRLVYAAFAGFFHGHVYRSTTAAPTGRTSRAICPICTVEDLLIDPRNPQTLYAATDVGVFRTTNGGADWAVYRHGLPPVRSLDLEFQEATGLLAAGHAWPRAVGNRHRLGRHRTLYAQWQRAADRRRAIPAALERRRAGRRRGAGTEPRLSGRRVGNACRRHAQRRRRAVDRAGPDGGALPRAHPPFDAAGSGGHVQRRLPHRRALRAAAAPQRRRRAAGGQRRHAENRRRRAAGRVPRGLLERQLPHGRVAQRGPRTRERPRFDLMGAGFAREPSRAAARRARTALPGLRASQRYFGRRFHHPRAPAAAHQPAGRRALRDRRGGKHHLAVRTRRGRGVDPYQPQLSQRECGVP